MNNINEGVDTGIDVKIGVVIVTYNRLSLLQTALRCFEEQTYLPIFVIVVDNACTDGTSDYLNEWKSRNELYEKIIVRNEKNEGGAGGFYAGLAVALKKTADYIWVSDDDAYPDKDALLFAAEFLKTKNHEDISAICGKVINNNQIDYFHRKSYIRCGINIVESYPKKELYNDTSFEINCFSYVGSIISRKKMIEEGLPIKDYFIAYDDSEHSLRLSKVGKIYCIPKITVYHNVSATNDVIDWKTYYGYRNKIDMFRRHFPWYCYYYYLLQLTLCLIVWNFNGKGDKHKVVKDAIRDAVKQRLGISVIYTPGWKSGENALKIED